MPEVDDYRLVAGLAQLVQGLQSRRAMLLDELRGVERDLEAAARTIDTAARLGFRNNTTPAKAPATPQRAPATPPRESAEPGTPQAPDGAVEEPPADTLAAHTRMLVSLGKLGFNSAQMAAAPRTAGGLRLENADLPTDGPALEAIRDSVAGVAERAAKAPPGPGGRGRLSSKGLVPGEPMAPAIMNILAAADRPLGSAEVASAMLRMRGLDIRGKEFTALVSRVSAILGQKAAKRQVRRLKGGDEKAKRWCLPEAVQKPD
jgi:hypothetical protein